MPESLVQVTEGTGKKLHTFQRTIGANNVEDEVIVAGEQYLASYTIGADVVTTAAGGTTHLLQIMAGASLKVRVRRIEIWQQANATTATRFDLRLVRLNTAGTGGTVIVPQAMDPADPAAGCTAMANPTTGGSEAAVAIYRAFPYAVQTIPTAMWGGPLVVWDLDRPRSKSFIIPAGTNNGIVVRNFAAVAGAVLGVTALVDEGNF